MEKRAPVYPSDPGQASPVAGVQFAQKPPILCVPVTDDSRRKASTVPRSGTV